MPAAYWKQYYEPLRIIFEIKADFPAVKFVASREKKRASKVSAVQNAFGGILGLDHPPGGRYTTVMVIVQQKPKVVVVCGPTASGKTDGAIRLAATFGAEIVSADSMQVYRYMDIGTAKPTAAERARVYHHLIDVVDPDEPFDAETYVKMARDSVADIRRRNLTPIVAGGTGLYLKAFVHGLFRLPPVDRRIRDRLASEAADRGTGPLYERLRRLDPETASRIHTNDRYRILRALEVLASSGQPISSWHAAHRFADCPFEVLQIGLNIERQRLYERIDRRAEEMIAAGLADEVAGLLDNGYRPELKSMQSIGYRHMVDFLQGRTTHDEALRTMQRDTRRYAKRQMTWFRADAAIRWIDPDRFDEAREMTAAFLGTG